MTLGTVVVPTSLGFRACSVAPGTIQCVLGGDWAPGSGRGGTVAILSSPGRVKRAREGPAVFRPRRAFGAPKPSTWNAGGAWHGVQPATCPGRVRVPLPPQASSSPSWAWGSPPSCLPCEVQREGSVSSDERGGLCRWWRKRTRSLRHRRSPVVAAAVLSVPRDQRQHHHQPMARLPQGRGRPVPCTPSLAKAAV